MAKHDHHALRPLRLVCSHREPPYAITTAEPFLCAWHASDFETAEPTMATFRKDVNVRLQGSLEIGK